MEIHGGLLASSYHIDQEARRLGSEGSQLKPMVITVEDTSLRARYQMLSTGPRPGLRQHGG